MYNYIFLDNNIELIDQIVKSTSMMIPLIETKTEINPVIYDTFKKILLFLKKVMNIIPDIKLSTTESVDLDLKTLLNEGVNKIVQIWDEFPSRNDEISETWLNFSFWWDEYYRKIRVFNNSENSILLSLN